MTKLSRVKFLTVSSQIITDICKRAIKDKLPEDSEVLRVQYDILSNNFKVVVYSKTFPKVPEGSEIPQLKDPVVSIDVLK